MYKYYGIYSSQIPFIPTPKELLKRIALIDLIKNFRPGYTLDIGCGPGNYLYDLSLMGFKGKAVDSSEIALTVARKLSLLYDCNFIFEKGLVYSESDSYDYVISLEVIEHIKIENLMIRDINKLLKKGGTLIMSVPAHKKLWSHHDIWAGHYRRYDKSEIINLLENEGFKIKEIISYGYPITTMLFPFRKILALWRLNKISKYNIEIATSGSGIIRTIWPRVHWLYLNELAKYFWLWIYNIQRKHYYSDKGDSYLLSAIKIN